MLLKKNRQCSLKVFPLRMETPSRLRGMKGGEWADYASGLTFVNH